MDSAEQALENGWGYRVVRDLDPVKASDGTIQRYESEFDAFINGERINQTICVYPVLVDAEGRKFAQKVALRHFSNAVQRAVMRRIFGLEHAL